MGTATDDTWTQLGPWYNQPCTYIEIDDAPFEPSMASSPQAYRYCKFVDDSSPSSPVWHSELIIGVDCYDFTLTGYRQLVVLGWHDNTAYLDTGKWYWIEGTHTFEEEPRTGRWGLDAQPGSGSSGAWFSAEAFAREFWFQVGWIVQPDINKQVFLTITDVSGNWIKVDGSYTGLGAKGTRFRIFAPPGVETYSLDAGLLSRWRAAGSSRCLYAGYDYEAPLAGRKDTGGVVARQDGKNYAGQHYTLHRHYDPYLMRFTSPDPIAASRNLFAYCENNPHGGYDPDGLELYGCGFDKMGVFGWPDKLNDIDPEMLDLAMQLGDHALSNMPGPIGHAYDQFKGLLHHGLEGAFWGDSAVNQYEAVWQRRGRAEQGFMDREFTIGAYMLGNQIGIIKGGDAIEGRDTFTGEKLSGGQRALYGVAAAGQYVGACLIVTGFADMQFNSMVNTPFVRTCGPIVRPTVPAPRMLRGTVNPANIESLRAMRAQESAKLPYQKGRPSYAKGQVEKVWESGKQLDGNVYDPNTGELLSWNKARSRAGQWDMGHKAGYEYESLYARFRSGEMSKGEFLRHYHDPANYHPEGFSANRSRQYQLQR